MVKNSTGRPLPTCISKKESRHRLEWHLLPPYAPSGATRCLLRGSLISKPQALSSGHITIERETAPALSAFPASRAENMRAPWLSMRCRSIRGGQTAFHRILKEAPSCAHTERRGPRLCAADAHFTILWRGAARSRAITSVAVVATPRDASKQGGQDRVRTLSTVLRRRQLR